MHLNNLFSLFAHDKSGLFSLKVSLKSLGTSSSKSIYKVSAFVKFNISGYDHRIGLPSPPEYILSSFLPGKILKLYLILASSTSILVFISFSQLVPSKITKQTINRGKPSFFLNKHPGDYVFPLSFSNSNLKCSMLVITLLIFVTFVS